MLHKNGSETKSSGHLAFDSPVPLKFNAVTNYIQGSEGDGDDIMVIDKNGISSYNFKLNGNARVTGTLKAAYAVEPTDVAVLDQVNSIAASAAEQASANKANEGDVLHNTRDEYKIGDLKIFGLLGAVNSTKNHGIVLDTYTLDIANLQGVDSSYINPRDISINYNGGNIGIGKVPDNFYKLDVNGKGRFSASVNTPHLLMNKHAELNQALGSIYTRLDGNDNFRISAAIEFIRNEEFDGSGADIVFKTNKQQTGIDATEKMRLNGEGALIVQKEITSENRIIAGTKYGFYNKGYVANDRNPIWAFANSEAYGLSYYQGNAITKDGGLDSIGVMFGDIVNPYIRFRSDGAGFFGGAVNLTDNNSLRLGSTDAVWAIQKNTDPIYGGFRIIKEGVDIAFRIDNNLITHTAKQVRLGSIGIDAMDAVTVSQLNSGITNLSNTVSNSYIPKNGSVTKTGTITFTDAPLLPFATLDSHAINKKQMEDILESALSDLQSNIKNLYTPDIRLLQGNITINNNSFNGTKTITLIRDTNIVDPTVTFTDTNPVDGLTVYIKPFDNPAEGGHYVIVDFNATGGINVSGPYGQAISSWHNIESQGMKFISMKGKWLLFNY